MGFPVDGGAGARWRLESVRGSLETQQSNHRRQIYRLTVTGLHRRMKQEEDLQKGRSNKRKNRAPTVYPGGRTSNGRSFRSHERQAKMLK